MRIDWLSVVTGVALLVAAVLLAAACASSAPIPDPRYSGGLGVCVADVAIAKAKMRLADAGIDKPALYDRYAACVEQVEAISGFDAGGQ